jgi:hypothetical protein
MYCFLLQIFMFQLSSTSIYGLHTKHAIPSNACLDPLETSEAHCAPRYIFNALHFNNEHRRTPSTLCTKLTSKEKKSQSNKQKKEGFKPLGSLTFFAFMPKIQLLI